MSAKGRTASTPWRLYLGSGLIAAAAFFLVPEGAQDFYVPSVGLTAVIAILVGTRINRPVDPFPWYLFALGQFLFAAGDFTLNYYDLTTGDVPFPSIADGFYLSSYPILTLGLALIVRKRNRGADRAGLLDALTIATGAGVVS